MPADSDLPANLQKHFQDELLALWPVLKGSLAEVRKPCIRPNCAACEEALRNDGIDIRLDSSVENLEADPEGAAVLCSINGKTARVAGSHTLIAAGRAPNTEELNLPAGALPQMHADSSR